MKCNLQPLDPPGPGIYGGVPEDEYRGWGAWCQSLIKSGPTLAHIRSKMDSAYSKSTPEQVIGTIVHREFFSPGTGMPPNIDVAPSDVTEKTSGGWRTFSKASREAGRIPMLQSEIDDAMAVVTAIRGSRDVAKLMAKATQGCEVSMVWTDPLVCKARIDWLVTGAGGLMIDLKTCASADYDAFSDAIARYGYHQQAAWYLDGYEALTGLRVPYVFIAAEKEPPYATAVYVLDDSTVEAGRALNARTMADISRAISENRWPGYERWTSDTDPVQSIGLPSWYLRKIDALPVS